MLALYVRLLLVWWLVAIASPRPGTTEQESAVPDAAEIARMLDDQPLSPESWLFWRNRYVDWYYDRSGQTDRFGDAIRDFIATQVVTESGELPDYLVQDAVAWSLLAWSLLHQDQAGREKPLPRAEQASRMAIELDPAWPGGHSALAVSLVFEVAASPLTMTDQEQRAKLEEAKRVVENYRNLSPLARPAWHLGTIAMAEERFAEAEAFYREALQDYPHSDSIARWLVQAVLAQEERDAGYSTLTGPLVERFPDSGQLRLLHAVALLRDGDGEAAAEHVEKARDLGTEAESVLGKEAGQTLREAVRLMTGVFREGMRAFEANRFAEAERCFRKALAENPNEVRAAEMLAMSILAQRNSPSFGRQTARRIEELCLRFPDSGDLQVLFAAALMREGRAAEAAEALDRAEQLGTDPASLMGHENVRQIREAARPGLIMILLHVMGGFGLVYTLVILMMAGTGVVLAAVTHGRPPIAPPQFESPSNDQLDTSRLAKLYLLAMAVSLVLFYVSVPFVTVGLVAVTLGLLYLIFLLPRVPLQLVVFVLIAGLGMAWAVLKSVFTRAGQEEFGLKKTADDCPRLHTLVREVAERTDTDPVDEIYLNPGSNIGVRQEGRGPFGLFGVKQRVLTLGMSSMRFLTVKELKAILAHEYAHFSHRDTFYIRFIERVPMSIAYALTNMETSLGRMNYINPFYWFFWLYYRAYTLLSAGFSRSREFLADRVAVRLYGREAFIEGLTGVATDGALFEMTMYQHIASMLAEGKAFINAYEAFDEFCEKGISPEDREKLYHSLLAQESSMFATHPSFRERLAAIADFPSATEHDSPPASSLLEDPEAIERELTEYLTSYFGRAYQAAQEQEE